MFFEVTETELVFGASADILPCLATRYFEFECTLYLEMTPSIPDP